MPAAVACPKCKMKYSLPDSLLGKPVQCKKCGSRFQVGQPAAAKEIVLKERSKKTPVHQPNPSELAHFGLDGPIRNTPELFGNTIPAPGIDPLANHIVHDPGFAESEYDEVEDQVDEKKHDLAALYENPALKQKKQRRKKDEAVLSEYISKDDGKLRSLYEKEEAKSDVVTQPWFWVLMISLICMAVAIATPFIYADYPKKWYQIYAYGLFPLGLLLGVGSWIWLLIKTSVVKESASQMLMVCFVPFYFFSQRKNEEFWEKIKNPGAAFYSVVIVTLITCCVFGLLVGIGSVDFSRITKFLPFNS